MVKVAELKLKCRVHNIYLQKKKLIIFTIFTFTEKKTNLKFPPSSSSSSSTPGSPLLLPLNVRYFLQNILKHTFSKEIIGNNWNS